jgi:hypothetical protein
MAPRAAFELPPPQPLSFGSPGIGVSQFDLPRTPQAPPAEAVKPPPPTEEPPADAAPATIPGGVSLPFDPRAQEALPFDLPDDTSSPISFELPATSPRSGSSPLELPEPAPFSFELPNAPPAPFERLQQSPPLADRAEGELPEAELAPPEAPPLDLGRVQPDELLHIFCPTGHRLKISRNLLGKEAVCPACKQRFLVRLGNTREFQRQKAKRRASEEGRMARIWLSIAIVAAVLVVAGMIMLIVSSHAP